MIDAAEDVAQPVVRGLAVVHAGQRIVVEQLHVHDVGVEESLHELAVHGPVDDVGIEVYPEPSDQLLDVVLRQLRVPAIVHVHGQWAQPEVDRAAERERAIDATGQADDAVVVLATPCFLHMCHELGTALVALSFVDDEKGLGALEKCGAVVANAAGVEADAGSRRIHDATRTDSDRRAHPASPKTRSSAS